jgi:3-isopropylmalate/(R)-2-methylmalate dehydratase small subunit
MKELVGKAKCVIVDDIDTDNIFHASLLTIHEPEKIKPHIFGNLKNFENFGQQNHTNKILFVGKNFGKGSTRQQAVTGFLAHGFQAIVGESFGPIYYGNAVNAGLLLIEVPDLKSYHFEDDDEIKISIENSELENITKGHKIDIKPIPQPLLDIRESGGLLELGKTWN